MSRSFFSLPLVALFAVAAYAASGPTVRAAPDHDDHKEHHDHKEAHGHAHGHAHGAGQEPTNLRVVMTGLRVQMIHIQEALWLEDYATLESAARGLADHPPLSAEEQARIKTTLGDDYSRFNEVDHALHEKGIQLAEAAAAKDLDRTLQALSAVQAGCMACHTQFRPALLTTGTTKP